LITRTKVPENGVEISAIPLVKINGKEKSTR
jgi:hypothetical protein